MDSCIFIEIEACEVINIEHLTFAIHIDHISDYWHQVEARFEVQMLSLMAIGSRVLGSLFDD